MSDRKMIWIRRITIPLLATSAWISETSSIKQSMDRINDIWRVLGWWAHVFKQITNHCKQWEQQPECIVKCRLSTQRILGAKLLVQLKQFHLFLHFFTFLHKMVCLSVTLVPSPYTVWQIKIWQIHLWACLVQRHFVLDGVHDPRVTNPQLKHATTNCCSHLKNRNKKQFQLLPNYSVFTTCSSAKLTAKIIIRQTSFFLCICQVAAHKSKTKQCRKTKTGQVFQIHLLNSVILSDIFQNFATIRAAPIINIFRLCDDVDDDDDEGRINFSKALSPKTTRRRSNKLIQ